MLSSVVWDCVLWYLKFQTSCSRNMTTNKLAGEVFLYSIKSKQSPKIMKLVEIPWYYVELWYKFEKVPWKLSHMMLRNQDISTCDILYVKYMMMCRWFPGGATHIPIVGRWLWTSGVPQSGLRCITLLASGVWWFLIILLPSVAHHQGTHSLARYRQACVHKFIYLFDRSILPYF